MIATILTHTSDHLDEQLMRTIDNKNIMHMTSTLVYKTLKYKYTNKPKCVYKAPERYKIIY